MENNDLIKEDKDLDSSTSVVSPIDKSIKKELTKSIVLFSILILAIAIFAYINYRHEREFKREFELPGAQVKDF